MKSHLWGTVCAVLFAFITVSANAALVSQLGGRAAYDDVLDITWITNAGLSGGNNWDNQVAWAVRDGDTVPIPAAVWLFGTGLLGLVGVEMGLHLALTLPDLQPFLRGVMSENFQEGKNCK